MPAFFYTTRDPVSVLWRNRVKREYVHVAKRTYLIGVYSVVWVVHNGCLTLEIQRTSSCAVRKAE